MTLYDFIVNKPELLGQAKECKSVWELSDLLGKNGLHVDLHDVAIIYELVSARCEPEELLNMVMGGTGQVVNFLRSVEVKSFDDGIDMTSGIL